MTLHESTIDDAPRPVTHRLEDFVRFAIVVSCCAISACDSPDWNRPAAGEVAVKVAALPGGRKTAAQLYETALKAETTLVISDRTSWVAFWKRAVDDFASGEDPAPSWISRRMSCSSR